MLNKKALFSNERGAQSLEWLGIAALLIMVVGIVSTFLSDSGTETINSVLESIMTNIQDQIGD